MQLLRNPSLPLLGLLVPLLLGCRYADYYPPARPNASAAGDSPANLSANPATTA